MRISDYGTATVFLLVNKLYVLADWLKGEGSVNSKSIGQSDNWLLTNYDSLIDLDKLLKKKTLPLSRPQSRQSAGLSLQSSESPSRPLTSKRVLPPPLWFQGGRHTRWRGRGRFGARSLESLEDGRNCFFYQFVEIPRRAISFLSLLAKSGLNRSPFEISRS